MIFARKNDSLFLRGNISFDFKFIIIVLGFFILTNPLETLSSPTSDLKQTNGNSGVCYTQACNETAATFLRNMDPNVDPCDDFYKYACGNFLKRTEVPEGMLTLSPYEDIMIEAEKQLNRSLNANSTSGKKPFKLAKNLYQSCVNTEKIEEIGIRDVLMKMQSMGGWPVIEGDAWNKSAFDWLNTTYKLLQYGYPADYLIDLEVSVVPSKSGKLRRLRIDQPSFGIASEYLNQGTSNENVTDYLGYMINVTEAFGAQRTRAHDEMFEVLRFEIQLSNVTIPEGEKFEYHHRPYDVQINVSQMNEKYSTIPWLEYINTQLPASLTVGEDETVIVTFPDYIKKLESILAQTPKRVIANYLMWRVALHSIPYLNKKMRDYEVAFKEWNVTSRSHNCINFVRKNLWFATDAVYVRDHFNVEKKNEILNMVQRLNGTFFDLLYKNEWMDNEAREGALNQLAKTSYNIAYSEDLLNDQMLDEYYKELELSEDSYLENALKLRKFYTNKDLSELRQPVVMEKWKKFSHVSEVKAYHSRDNDIFLTAALLQGTYFHKDRPKYANYGGLGTIIGHEITHGFARSDLQPFNIIPIRWFSAQTTDNYWPRLDCIKEQYSNYSVEDIERNINGERTAEENIADVGGVKIAYEAYKRWVKENGEEERLPGIDRSPEQLFWLSSANSFCSKYRRDYLFKFIDESQYSTHEFRAIGSLRNSKEFAKDYNCPSGSKMNPVDKCIIW